MKLVVQRVSRASVEVGGTRSSRRSARGLLVFVGAEKGDDAAQAEEARARSPGCAIFADADGKMNLSLGDVAGSVLAVSQFTLAADLSRGRRPGFERALPAAEAEPLYEHFCAALELAGVPVARGVFGADMKVVARQRRPRDVRDGGEGAGRESGVG